MQCKVPGKHTGVGP